MMFWAWSDGKSNHVHRMHLHLALFPSSLVFAVFVAGGPDVQALAVCFRLGSTTE